MQSRERFSYWREVVCQTVLSVSTEHPANGFSASIASRTFGNLRLASFESTSHGIVRNNCHVAMAPEASYLVSLQIRGRSNITQGEESFCLEPGEIAIVDSERPFRVGFPDSVHRILAIVPREMLSQRAPWMKDARSCRKLTLSGPYIDLARRHLVHLTRGDDDLSTSEAVLMVENLCNLLTLASAREVRPNSLAPELMMQSILTFCRQHLHNPELSPSLVASHLGISVRTLTSQSLFQGEHEIGIDHGGSLYRLKITRQGKLIELELAETDAEKAKADIKAMCEKLLANTVIENYAIE
ncbi:MAG: phosphoribosylformylglycinamidine synthase subunit PurS, partial [Hyphomicrobium sp.]|nr:phosphoribosylformylglycinamidine synthase subunit PurS [Hyphomicrobium sp.]